MVESEPVDEGIGGVLLLVVILLEGASCEVNGGSGESPAEGETGDQDDDGSRGDEGLL